MNVDQIAHDLAMAYINNRYGVNVTGTFSVQSSTNYESDTVKDVTGEGSVETSHLPGLFDPHLVRVGSGTRSLFGIGPEKTRLEATGEYAVDHVFRNMIADYHNAYQRFLGLLQAK
jgi:hypothetical protein